MMTSRVSVPVGTFVTVSDCDPVSAPLASTTNPAPDINT
jgi:hypothetical protein